MWHQIYEATSTQSKGRNQQKDRPWLVTLKLHPLLQRKPFPYSMQYASYFRKNGNLCNCEEIQGWLYRKLWQLLEFVISIGEAHSESHRPFFMALLALGGCARICAPRPAHVRHRGAFAFATLSPSRGHAAGDWVEATSTFFEQDTRPIMLFDGKPHFL